MYRACRLPGVVIPGYTRRQGGMGSVADEGYGPTALLGLKPPQQENSDRGACAPVKPLAGGGRGTT
eukprot:scaffold135764_cov28-Tisochrysis_lutea.AAC.1